MFILQKLLQLAKKPKVVNEFKQNVMIALNYIRDKLFAKYLEPIQKRTPLYELYLFSDISAVRPHILGAPRAAIHTALNNPHSYLQVF